MRKRATLRTVGLSSPPSSLPVHCIKNLSPCRELNSVVRFRLLASSRTYLSTFGNSRILSPRFTSHPLLSSSSSSSSPPTSPIPHSANIVTLHRRSYARRAVNTSDTKLNVLKQYWETHLKRYVKYGALGVVGLVVGLPFAIVGGIGYGVYALIRAGVNRMRARAAGTTLAEWNGLQQEKKSKKPGFLSFYLNASVRGELSFRLKCLDLLNEDPEVLTKLGPSIMISETREDPDKGSNEDEDDYFFNVSSFYVKSMVTNREAIVTAKGKAKMEDFAKFGDYPPPMKTQEEMDRYTKQTLSYWKLLEVTAEIQDTGEEIVVLGPGKKQQQQQPKRRTVEEVVVEEIEIEYDDDVDEAEAEDEGKAKRKRKRKTANVIDVPFQPVQGKRRSTGK